MTDGEVSFTNGIQAPSIRIFMCSGKDCETDKVMALKNKIQMPPLTLWTYRLKQIQRFKFKIKILND